MKCLEVYGKPVPLHCVFHGIRFKVNGRLVVEMTTFFFLKRRVRVDAPLFAVTTHSLNLETWGGFTQVGGHVDVSPGYHGRRRVFNTFSAQSILTVTKRYLLSKKKIY